MTRPEEGRDAPPLVDLRSDTVTRPGPAMRKALARAVVGDDALGDDPTMHVLETRVAEMLGKERALFFPSGTMANQAALGALGVPGTGVVAESRAHVIHWEEGGAAVLSGLQMRPVATPDGLMRPDRVAEVLNPRNRYLLRDSVICVENTHMDAGGRVTPLSMLRELRALADERGLAIHLDGARLWNASVATGVHVREYAAEADTVMVALSKGLGAPIGSMLAGAEQVLERAWHIRRRLGGAMRQTGILAEAALHALENNMERLAQDHTHATELAKGVGVLPAVSADRPETNIVFIDVHGGPANADNLLNFLKNRRILMSRFGPTRLRAVTHLDVDGQGIVRTLAALTEASMQT